MKSLAVALLAILPVVVAQAPNWGQCGGIGWTGPTVCAQPEAWCCIYNNPWHSNCLACPGTTSTTTTTAVLTTTTAKVKTTATIKAITTKAPQPTSCPLPTTYNWTDSGILANPSSSWYSLRDFTSTIYNGKHLVYATVQSYLTQPLWGSVAFSPFATWRDMNSTSQITMPFNTIAPTLFKFAPKNIWVVAYQWSTATFSYRTSNDPTNINSWSAERPLFTGSITNSGTGPIDQTLIADNKDIYLFFTGDNGKIYRASMPLASFPGSFGSVSTIALNDTTANIFEGVQVYTVKGQNLYLLIVESIGRSGRYLRSYTATSLSGTWTPQATSEAKPFAGKANSNVAWANEISGGDLTRENPDQTFTVDACKLEFLYTGRVIQPIENFGQYKYRPGLLTLKK